MQYQWIIQLVVVDIGTNKGGHVTLLGFLCLLIYSAGGAVANMIDRAVCATAMTGE